MATCAICGKENPAGVEYCEDCGAALAPTATPAVAAESPPVPAGDSAEMPASEPPFTPQDESATVPAPVEVPASAPAGTTAPPSTPIVNPRLAPKRYGAVSTDEIPLQGDRLVVGRFDPETGPVDIDLSGTPEADQLSRHHAELYREADGEWYVQDLGSTNGVFVKRPGSSTFGPRLTTPTALMPGDEVAFGNARFVFKAD